MKVGQWLVILVFLVAALSQLYTGMAYLLGTAVPETPGMTVPAEQQELAAKLAGGVALVVGGIYALAAWGLHRWASWARILGIGLCGLGLVGLVVISFLMRLTLPLIASALVQVVVLVWFFHPRVQAMFRTGGKG